MAEACDTVSCERKRGDLREALIAHAEAATRNGTIETISLRAVARALGVSSGAVYRHFPDKEALIVEIVRLGWMRLRAAAHAIRPEGAVAGSPQEAVARAYAIGHLYLRFAIANPTLWRLMFGRIGQICRTQMMGDAELMRYTVLDVACENARDLHRLGVLEENPCLADTRFMWSALHGAADLVQSGARQDAETADKVAEETVFRALCAIGCPRSLAGTAPAP